MRMYDGTKPSDTDAFIFKGGASGTEYVLPNYVGRHLPYDPRQLPVCMKDTPNMARCIALISMYMGVD